MDSNTTQEEKELLLKDISARLPYGVKVKIQYYDDVCKLQAIYSNGTTYATRDIEHHIETYFEECKPYLFPLSSMTEEQKKELENLGWNFDNFEINNVKECLGTYKEFVTHSDCFILIDWCNKNHFDYRGLIPMDLAIDATGLNIY